MTSTSIAAAPPATIHVQAAHSSGSTFVAQVRTAPPPTDAATTRWLETEMNGITLGMWRPDDWQSDTSEGLLMAEPSKEGILVYVSLPSMNEFDISLDVNNYALEVLKQVVRTPSHTGQDVAFSQPAGFQWDDYQAAYYLLSTADGVRVLVLVLAIPDQPQVVVCTVSTTVAHKSRIREMLPWVLDGLQIDGTSLRGESLNVLPNPLPFPRYNQRGMISSQPTVSPP